MEELPKAALSGSYQERALTSKQTNVSAAVPFDICIGLALSGETLFGE